MTLACCAKIKPECSGLLQGLWPLLDTFQACLLCRGLTTVPEPTKQSAQGNTGGTVPLTRQLHNMEGLVHRVLRDKPNPSARSELFLPLHHCAMPDIVHARNNMYTKRP